MEPAQGSELQLRHEGSSGYRHYLDGRAVHAGATLELLTDNGWQPGRYEWSFDPDSRPYLVTDSDNDDMVTLDEYALLRWVD